MELPLHEQNIDKGKRDIIYTNVEPRTALLRRIRNTNIDFCVQQT